MLVTLCSLRMFGATTDRLVPKLASAGGRLAESRSIPPVDAKGCNVDVEGYYADVKGYDADVKG